MMTHRGHETLAVMAAVRHRGNEVSLAVDGEVLTVAFEEVVGTEATSEEEGCPGTWSR